MKNKITCHSNNPQENEGALVCIVHACECIDKCGNVSCFFYKRDILGHNPFPAHDENWKPDYTKTVFPDFRATVGTNCYYVKCDDFESRT